MDLLSGRKNRSIRPGCQDRLIGGCGL
jgi:hypothetical protein